MVQPRKDLVRASLRAAVRDLPPSSINLDGIMARERRRFHRQVVATSVGAGVGVFLLVAGVVLGVAGTAPRPAAVAIPSGDWATALCDAPANPASPEPGLPEPRVGATIQRLTTALAYSLADHLPGRDLADYYHPGCPWIQFQYLVDPAHYEALAALPDGAQLTITVVEGGLPGWSSFLDHRLTEPDGTVVTWSEEGIAVAHHTDGTGVAVVVPSAIGADVAIAIAIDPDLSLPTSVPVSLPEVSGVVLDRDTQQPVAGVLVQLQDSWLHLYQTTTEDDGTFSFQGGPDTPIVPGYLGLRGTGAGGRAAPLDRFVMSSGPALVGVTLELAPFTAADSPTPCQSSPTVNSGPCTLKWN